MGNGLFTYILFQGLIAHHIKGVLQFKPYSIFFTKLPKIVGYIREKKLKKPNMQKYLPKIKILNYYFYFGHVPHHLEAVGEHSFHSDFYHKNRWSIVKK